MVERQFGGIAGGPEVPPLPGTPELDPVIGDTVRDTVVSEVPLPRVYYAARVPPYTSEGFYAAEVAASVLGSGRASRLYRSVVRERRVAKDVVSYVFPLCTGGAMLLLWVTGYPGADPETLEEELVGEIDGMREVRPNELGRAVALTETHLVNTIQQVGERADLLSMFDQLFDDPGRLNTEIERLRRVTTDGVVEFASLYLGPDNRAILTYVPEASS
jgi:predicted Zn-dependent peptidase